MPAARKTTTPGRLKAVENQSETLFKICKETNRTVRKLDAKIDALQLNMDNGFKRIERLLTVE